MKLIMFVASVGLLFLVMSINPFLDKKTEFTPKYKFGEHLIKTKDGRILEFNDSLKLPPRQSELVGYLDKDDKIYKYRNKLQSKVGEIVYFFGFQDIDPYKYKNGNTTVKKGNGAFQAVFWFSIIIGFIVFMIRIFNNNWQHYFGKTNLKTSMRESRKFEKYSSFYFVVEFLTTLLLSFYIMNYNSSISWFTIGIIIYPALILIYECLKEESYVDISKKIILYRKKEDYNKEYNRLLE